MRVALWLFKRPWMDRRVQVEVETHDPARAITEALRSPDARQRLASGYKLRKAIVDLGRDSGTRSDST